MCALFSEAIWPQHLLSRYRQVTQAAISIPRHLIIGPGTAFTFMAVSAAFVGSGLTTIAYDSKKIDIMSQRVWKKGRNRMQCEADVLSLAVFAKQHCYCCDSHPPTTPEKLTLSSAIVKR